MSLEKFKMSSLKEKIASKDKNMSGVALPNPWTKPSQPPVTILPFVAIYNSKT